MANINGTEIDLTPTEGMREEAERYRAWKAEGREGGQEAAATRAGQILSGDEIGPDTVITMRAWFARHEVDKQAEGFDPGEDGYPSPGRVAWAAWGGDPGKTWADAKAARIEELREQSSAAASSAATTAPRAAVQLLSETDGALRLGLYGEVGWDITVAGVTRALKEADGRPITISVDSYGGDALQGIAIHNLLARYPGKKRAVVEGVAASAASLFPLAADVRIMPTNAFLMIHEAWGGVMGDAADMRAQADVLERISAAYRKTYAGATGVSEEEVAVMMRDETWMTGDEALMAGFVTEVSEPREIKAAVRRPIPEGRFARIPAALVEASVCLEGHNDDDDEAAGDSLLEILEPDLSAEEIVVPTETETGDDLDTLPPCPPAGETTMSDQAAIEAASIAAREDERARVKTIRAMCARSEVGEVLAEQLIDDGATVDQAREIVLERVTARKPAQDVALASEGAAEIGMSKAEAKRFSFQRAYLALANPTDRALQEAAAFEFEVSRASQAKTGRPSAGIQVPYDVLRTPYRADLNTGTPGDGGFLVDDVLRPGDFIELLRNQLALAGLGVTILSGLQGDISIPRQVGPSTAYWVGEGGSPTESQQTVDQVNMSPKTLGAYVDYSRKLMMQSSIDVESMIRNDLVEVLGLEIDRAGLYGSGSSNQPLGLSGQAGIASVDLTGYGTFEEFVLMETEVATANAAVGNLGYLMNAATRGALKTTPKSGTDPIFVFEDGEVNGYRTTVSNQVAAKDVFFGNWSSMIMALWGGLDLMVDPYAGSTSGTVRVIALQSVDFAVKQPASFSYAQEATP
jgi:HK97 family phage major capsid protein